MLNLFQPSGELAQDAYTKLLTAVFWVVTETMDPTDLQSKIYQWVYDFLQEFVDRFDKWEPPETGKEEHEAQETAQAFKEAAHLMGDFANLADQITGLIVAERVSNIYYRSFGVGEKNCSEAFGTSERYQTKLPKMRNNHWCACGCLVHNNSSFHEVEGSSYTA